MIIHNMPQRSEEWYAVRRGKLTASNAQAIGNQEKGLETLCLECVADILTSGQGKENYDNADMERGRELEEKAKQLYSFMYDYPITEVGFIENDEYSGCSPDGLIHEDGMIEVKCPNNKVYTELLIHKKLDTKYIWQCQMQLLCTDRIWCDLVFYNRNFEKPLLVFNQVINDEMQQQLIDGIKKGSEIIQKYLKAVKS